MMKVNACFMPSMAWVRHYFFVQGDEKFGLAGEFCKSLYWQIGQAIGTDGWFHSPLRHRPKFKWNTNHDGYSDTRAWESGHH
jgi:hypothetical protein